MKSFHSLMLGTALLVSSILSFAEHTDQEVEQFARYALHRLITEEYAAENIMSDTDYQSTNARWLENTINLEQDFSLLSLENQKKIITDSSGLYLKFLTSQERWSDSLKQLMLSSHQEQLFVSRFGTAIQSFVEKFRKIKMDKEERRFVVDDIIRDDFSFMHETNLFPNKSAGQKPAVSDELMVVSYNPSIDATTLIAFRDLQQNPQLYNENPVYYQEVLKKIQIIQNGLSNLGDYIQPSVHMDQNTDIKSDNESQDEKLLNKRKMRSTKHQGTTQIHKLSEEEQKILQFLATINPKPWAIQKQKSKKPPHKNKENIRPEWNSSTHLNSTRKLNSKKQSIK